MIKTYTLKTRRSFFPSMYFTKNDPQVTLEDDHVQNSYSCKHGAPAHATAQLMHHVNKHMFTVWKSSVIWFAQYGYNSALTHKKQEQKS